MALTRKRWWLIMAVLFAGTAAVAFLCTLFGSERVSWSAVSPAADFWAAARGLALGRDGAIIFQLRLPRLLMAGVVGASLSVAGAGFQGLLRNPLADPYILGVSGGGALGAIVAMWLGVGLLWGRVPAVPLFAFAGALITVMAVFRIARVNGRVPAHTLLLAGVVANAFLSAVIMFVISVAGVNMAYSMVSWMMGTVGYETYSMILGVTAYAAAGAFVLMGLGRDFNLLALGEDAAAQTGVPVERVKGAAFFAASLVTGAVVSVSGLIGFVGLIVPHITRLIFGPDHRVVVPASIFVGAMFLMVCDTLARVVIAPSEIPVGVVTALCGGPFFIFLLRRRQGRGFAEG
ncbi:MAG TPA: iron ABC transporter permease [bacterium]|nr:iron ABC transporter permease [bacterium]